jgi:hypothetical protein
MILCPACQHYEFSGTLFCSECGAQLTVAEPLSTHSIYRSQSDGLNSTEPRMANNVTDKNQPFPSSGSPRASVVLRVVEGDHSLPLAGRSEYTLGRVAEGQPILPDVDLSPFDAYALGVSRLHAALKMVNQRIFVVDLGSSNGTRVNGQKIVSNVDYPINHGDTLTLGKLKLEVLTQHQKL